MLEHFLKLLNVSLFPGYSPNVALLSVAVHKGSLEGV